MSLIVFKLQLQSNFDFKVPWASISDFWQSVSFPNFIPQSCLTLNFFQIILKKKKRMQRAWKEPAGAGNSIQAEDLNFSFYFYILS